jgi:hypothetical protein
LRGLVLAGALSSSAGSLPLQNQLVAGIAQRGRHRRQTAKIEWRQSAYLFTDLLTRMENGWSQDQIDELMPWHWAPPNPH